MTVLLELAYSFSKVFDLFRFFYFIFLINPSFILVQLKMQTLTLRLLLLKYLVVNFCFPYFPYFLYFSHFPYFPKFPYFSVGAFLTFPRCPGCICNLFSIGHWSWCSVSSKAAPWIGPCFVINSDDQFIAVKINVLLFFFSFCVLTSLMSFPILLFCSLMQHDPSAKPQACIPRCFLAKGYYCLCSAPLFCLVAAWPKVIQ